MPDTMPLNPSALTALLDRASVPPRLLRAPAPDARSLELAVAAALRAPDHGGLRPWRFLVVEGPARQALGDILATAFAIRNPDAPADRVEQERAKPQRAPMVVVAAAAIRDDRPGVPPWEQDASAAAGIMNLLNALDAMGYGACWLSSPTLKDPAVKFALGFAETDSLLGWIHVGTPAPERPRPQRPDPAGFIRRWSPAESP